MLSEPVSGCILHLLVFRSACLGQLSFMIAVSCWSGASGGASGVRQSGGLTCWNCLFWESFQPSNAEVGHFYFDPHSLGRLHSIYFKAHGLVRKRGED